MVCAMALIDEFNAEVQKRINSKQYDSSEETDVSHDMFGNLSAKRLWASGQTRGSSIEVLDANKPLIRVTLEFDWTYKRKEFRGLLPPIDEDRTDTGKYVFEVTASLFSGMVISEKSREASAPNGDVNHDSARMGFSGMINDVIKPSFRIE